MANVTRFPSCPACTYAATPCCTCKPRCAPLCKLECHHCGDRFRAYRGGYVMVARVVRLEERG